MRRSEKIYAYDRVISIPPWIQPYLLFFPRLNNPTHSNSVLIEASGPCSRIGKTELINSLEKSFARDNIVHQKQVEEWEANKHLFADLGANPSKKIKSANRRESQLWFLRNKVRQVSNSPTEGGVILQDVSPEMDYMYAVTYALLKILSQKDFFKYLDERNKIDWSKVPAADGILFATASEPVLEKRVKESLREGESMDFFLNMAAVMNKIWLPEALSVGLPLHLVNTDTIDYRQPNTPGSLAIFELAKEIIISKQQAKSAA